MKTQKRPHAGAVRITFAGLLLTAAVLLLYLNGAFLPRWIRWNEADLSFTAPASQTLSVTLKGKRVSIRNSGGEVLYTSPRSWSVSDLLLYDIDRDGTEEALLLTWKRGSYGSARPFWVERDEAGFSQHVFIFRIEDGTLAPYWMSSKLGFEAAGWEIDEEGFLVLTDTGGQKTRWYWNYWGLALYE